MGSMFVLLLLLAELVFNIPKLFRVPWPVIIIAPLFCVSDRLRSEFRSLTICCYIEVYTKYVRGYDAMICISQTQKAPVADSSFAVKTHVVGTQLSRNGYRVQ